MEATPPSQVPPSTSQPPKPQRVLACVLCQQRKVKCDRKYPCSNCTKSRVQCVPATQVSRRRKRRFPERELLDRLRKYESLLRQHKIKFEPLHGESSEDKESPDADYETQGVGSVPAGSSPSTNPGSERGVEPKFSEAWYAIRQKSEDPDQSDSSNDVDYDVRDVVIKSAWNTFSTNDDHILFGARTSNVDISTLHPEPVQIFRLWQLYLESVDPMLKVTHTPTLQARIIDAISNLTGIEPELEALIFAIYSLAISSLSEEECQSMFGEPQLDILKRYRFGCQQALLNCSFLRTNNRDCLTALFLYLVSMKPPGTVPHSLSSMLGIAVRIAYRMGIHNELALAQCSVFEAEMRRRLWWSLVLFDTRVGELADFKTATLTPEWDCRPPLNVNEALLRPEMKEPPQVQGKSTESLFAVVRAEVGDFIRHSRFHRDFTWTVLKPSSKEVPKTLSSEGSEIEVLEKKINEKYLQFCDPEVPMQFATLWMTKGFLARCRLLEHHAQNYGLSDAQRNAAFSDALEMLECDTELVRSPITKKFQWLFNFYQPFFAFIHITQALKRRPTIDQAQRSWEIMSDNYEARYGFLHQDFNAFFVMFARIVMGAWAVYEASYKESGNVPLPPRIVVSLKHRLEHSAPYTEIPNNQDPNIASMGTNVPPAPLPGGFGNYSNPFLQNIYGGTDLSDDELFGMTMSNMQVDQLNWSAMDWDFGVNSTAGLVSTSQLPRQY